MLRSLERGLTLQDFEILTIGSIIDFVAAYNEDNRTDTKQTERALVRMANQNDYDRF